MTGTLSPREGRRGGGKREKRREEGGKGRGRRKEGKGGGKREKRREKKWSKVFLHEHLQVGRFRPWWFGLTIVPTTTRELEGSLQSHTRTRCTRQ